MFVAVAIYNWPGWDEEQKPEVEAFGPFPDAFDATTCAAAVIESGEAQGFDDVRAFVAKLRQPPEGGAS